jgi:hypothetical protein
MQQLFRLFNVVLSGNPLLHVTNAAQAQHNHCKATAAEHFGVTQR